MAMDSTSAGISSNKNLSSKPKSKPAVSEGFKNRFSDVSDTFNGQIERVTHFIKEKPMVTFAAALGVGFLVGTMILRNKHRSDSKSDYNTGSL